MILNIVFIVVLTICVCVNIFCYIFSEAKALSILTTIFAVVGIIVNAYGIYSKATPPQAIYEEYKENVEKAQQNLEEFLNEHPEFKEIE